MTPRSCDIIDNGKLTQRELLILLNNKVETMNKGLEKLSDDYIGLHTRVTKIETRIKVTATFWGATGVIIGLAINFIQSILK